MMVEINSSEDWVVMDFTFPTKVGWQVGLCAHWPAWEGEQKYIWASSQSGA